jgi:CMP/dCMP kinase
LKRLIIAIDGTAAAGKSTTARLVAERLDYLHIDTGAMYRAVAYAVLKNKINPDDRQAVGNLVRGLTIRLSQNEGLEVYINEERVTDKIRLPEVTAIVSKVSTFEEVRSHLVKEQREMARNGGVVLEGRDIGTVVFPDADLKFYFIAEIGERARRRYEELKTKGVSADYQSILDDIKRRDHIDSTRNSSPLKKADDAISVNTSNMTIREQVDYVLSFVENIKQRDEIRERGTEHA